MYRKGWWCREDGSWLRISEMTDKHLCNTLRMLMRNNEKKIPPGITDKAGWLGQRLVIFGDLLNEASQRHLDPLNPPLVSAFEMLEHRHLESGQVEPIGRAIYKLHKRWPDATLPQLIHYVLEA